MDITDYTSYNEIRSTCGLSTAELPDTKLAEEIYANTLSLALDDVVVPDDAPGPGPLAERFIEIDDTAEALRTTKEQKLYDLTRVFSTYAVAQEVVVSLSMRAPKSIGDSKASLVRFSPESTYELVIDTIRERLDDTKQKIEDINETTVSSMTYMSVVPPSTDRITNS